jgi:hypothetical protein
MRRGKRWAVRVTDGAGESNVVEHVAHLERIERDAPDPRRDRRIVLEPRDRDHRNLIVDERGDPAPEHGLLAIVETADIRVRQRLQVVPPIPV